MTNEPVETMVARLEGKVDVLGEKLDAKMSTVMDRIESATREQNQKFHFQDERFKNLSDKVEDNTKRITNIAKELHEVARTFDDRIDAEAEAIVKKREEKEAALELRVNMLEKFRWQLMAAVAGGTIGGGALGATVGKVLGL